MKHWIATFILLLALNHSWSQQPDELLLQAYRAHSPEKLELFFNQWAQETPALSLAAIEKSNDTVRNVYLLFQQFYNPIDIQRIGGSEWGNDIYKKANYFLLQDKVRFGFVETLDSAARLSADSNSAKNTLIEWPEPKQYVTIGHFRPRVSFQRPKTVVLTADYDSTLNRFLGGSHYPLGHGSIMSPAASSGESANRQKFLEKRIKIWYGHWGGYWQLHTYPLVTSIVFDNSLTHALINYRMVYEGGYAYFKKVGGTWTLIEARRTWIE